MKTYIQAGILVFSLFFLAGCEQEFFPVPSEDGPKYVVEGYVETGQNAIPVYLILRTTFEFYGEIGPDQFTESFVHDADVLVSDGNLEVKLQEVCFSELDSATLAIIKEQFGFVTDSLAIDFCVYVDLLNQLAPQPGRTYTLEITTSKGELITSSTQVPLPVPLDSLMFEPPPGDPNDTLAQLICYISDPGGVRNFYRYQGSTNGGQLETGFSSVEEDLFFDGVSFGFQLLNPQTSSGDAEPEEFGLYFVGDTMTLKWSTIDEANFDFWNTLEFSNANQGPFSSYTRLQSNITGGIGIWGGYHSTYYTRIVAY